MISYADVLSAKSLSSAIQTKNNVSLNYHHAFLFFDKIFTHICNFKKLDETTGIGYNR